MVEGPLEATWSRCDVTVHETGSGERPAARHHRKQLLRYRWLEEGGERRRMWNEEGGESENSRRKFEKEGC